MTYFYKKKLFRTNMLQSVIIFSVTCVFFSPRKKYATEYYTGKNGISNFEEKQVRLYKGLRILWQHMLLSRKAWNTSRVAYSIWRIKYPRASLQQDFIPRQFEICFCANASHSEINPYEFVCTLQIQFKRIGNQSEKIFSIRLNPSQLA